MASNQETLINDDHECCMKKSCKCSPCCCRSEERLATGDDKYVENCCTDGKCDCGSGGKSCSCSCSKKDADCCCNVEASKGCNCSCCPKPHNQRVFICGTTVNNEEQCCRNQEQSSCCKDKSSEGGKLL